MRLFVLVLNRTDKLDDLMTHFAAAGICGATILESTGMARELYGSHHDEEEISFLGSIRGFLDSGARRGNKTIFTVLRDEQLTRIIQIVEEVVGDLAAPDSGIMFSMPLDFARGKGLEK